MGDRYSTAKVDFGLLTPKCLLFMNENKASGISHCPPLKSVSSAEMSK